MKISTLSVILMLLILCPPRGQAQAAPMSAEILPLNSMVTVTAPDAPLDRNSAPRKLARYSWSSFAPYVKVYRFIVEPGKKYTFHFRHPADGIYRNAMIKTETPLTDDMATYTKEGSTGFVTYGQQPWKDPKGNLFRHNFSISPKSDNPSLYMVLQCGKPGISFGVMLKSPPDSDDDVKKSAPNSLGTIWSAPLVLSAVPGTAPGPPSSPPPGSGTGNVSTATPTPGPTGSPTLTISTLGSTWTVNEAGRWFGTWVRRPGTTTFDATWKNNSGQVVKDTITIESLQGTRVVMVRQGNGGRYYGTLSPDGRKIVNGTTSWYKKGDTWSARISGI